MDDVDDKCLRAKPVNKPSSTDSVSIKFDIFNWIFSKENSFAFAINMLTNETTNEGKTKLW